MTLSGKAWWFLIGFTASSAVHALANADWLFALILGALAIYGVVTRTRSSDLPTPRTSPGTPGTG